MKSFCASALVLVACLSWTASQAAAQAGAYGSTGVVAASYHLPPGGTGPYGSMFASSEPTPAAQPQSDQLIDGADGPSAFERAVQSEWAGCDTCDDMTCGSCGTSCGAWFGAMGGLAMGRNRPNYFWTTEDSGTGELLLNTQNAGANWTGGWQISVGYMFGGAPCGNGGGCGPYGPIGSGAATGPGIGFTYWGLGNMNGFAQVDSTTNSLDATFTSSVTIGGQPFSDFFDGSASQRIHRDDSASNYELNLFFGTFNHYRWTIVPFAGFRYFRFDERLIYEALAGGGTWGGNGGLDQAGLSFDTTNNLFGLQLGTYATYQVFNRFSWFIGPKLGLFGNQMINRSTLVRGDGAQGFDVTSYKSDFSLLGEIDTGFNWVVGRHFTAYAGYRVLGVTNVALGDNQFLDGVGEVQQSGSLILHGMMMGGGWTF